jgi:hypothetical protein
MSEFKKVNVRPFPVCAEIEGRKSKLEIRKTKRAKPNEAIELKNSESIRLSTFSQNEANAVNPFYFIELRTKNGHFPEIMNGLGVSLSPFCGRAEEC